MVKFNTTKTYKIGKEIFLQVILRHHLSRIVTIFLQENDIRFTPGITGINDEIFSLTDCTYKSSIFKVR